MTFAIRARVMVLALAGSLALAAAVPFLLDAIATAPSGEVAGTVATPAPSPSSDPAVASSAPDPLDPPGAAPATMVRLPDPIGDRSAPARRPADPSTLTGYVWPLPGSRLTLPFGPSPWGSRVVDGESFHDGLDLATFCGDRVVAAHDGTVLAAGRRYDRHIGWLGDLDAVPGSARRQEPVDHPADRGRHRRRQRLPEHLRALSRRRRQAGRRRQGRPAARVRGDDRPGLRLPRPLRTVQPVRGCARSGSARTSSGGCTCPIARSPGSIPATCLPPLE